jgi:hypothetical protein
MRKLSLLMTLAVGNLSAPAFAQGSAPAAPPAAAAATPAPAAASAPEIMPKTHQEWVVYLSDFTRNAEMMSDPKKFVAAMNAISEPGFFAIAMKSMMDPNLYARSMASAMDSRAYANYARMMDPITMMAWMQALADPQFLNAMATMLSDQGKIMRWMMTPMDPNVTTMALGMMNPNTYVPMATAPVNPNVWGTAMVPMNPNWYAGWANTMISPQSYGPTWGNWFATPYGMVPVQPVPAR